MLHCYWQQKLKLEHRLLKNKSERFTSATAVEQSVDYCSTADNNSNTAAARCQLPPPQLRDCRFHNHSRHMRHIHKLVSDCNLNFDDHGPANNAFSKNVLFGSIPSKKSVILQNWNFNALTSGVLPHEHLTFCPHISWPFILHIALQADSFLSKRTNAYPCALNIRTSIMRPYLSNAARRSSSAKQLPMTQSKISDNDF